MNLGCGNSELSEDMYDDGFLNIYNIDIAANVIHYMKERNYKRNKMTCKREYYIYINKFQHFIFFVNLKLIIIVEVMDVRALTYKDNTFDFIIDKSTIDALLCGENSYINVATMLKEVQRVLKDGGYYMIISYGLPENRINHLERIHLDFEISVYTIKKDYEENEDLSKVHYVYVCKKKIDANKVAEKNFLLVKEELEEQELIDKELREDEEEERDDYSDDIYNNKLNDCECEYDNIDDNGEILDNDCKYDEYKDHDNINRDLYTKSIDGKRENKNLDKFNSLCKKYNKKNLSENLNLSNKISSVVDINNDLIIKSKFGTIDSDIDTFMSKSQISGIKKNNILPAINNNTLNSNKSTGFK